LTRVHVLTRMCIPKTFVLATPTACLCLCHLQESKRSIQINSTVMGSPVTSSTTTNDVSVGIPCRTRVNRASPKGLGGPFLGPGSSLTFKCAVSRSSKSPSERPWLISHWSLCLGLSMVYTSVFLYCPDPFFIVMFRNGWCCCCNPGFIALEKSKDVSFETSPETATFRGGKLKSDCYQRLSCSHHSKALEFGISCRYKES
jgi:hypothetical protein